MIEHFLRNVEKLAQSFLEMLLKGKWSTNKKKEKKNSRSRTKRKEESP
jgi:hypothetical protein